jgi:hypothetical protein
MQTWWLQYWKKRRLTVTEPSANTQNCVIVIDLEKYWMHLSSPGGCHFLKKNFGLISEYTENLTFNVLLPHNKQEGGDKQKSVYKKKAVCYLVLFIIGLFQQQAAQRQNTIEGPVDGAVIFDFHSSRGLT